MGFEAKLNGLKDLRQSGPALVLYGANITSRTHPRKSVEHPGVRPTQIRYAIAESAMNLIDKIAVTRLHMIDRPSRHAVCRLHIAEFEQRDDALSRRVS